MPSISSTSLSVGSGGGGGTASSPAFVAVLVASVCLWLLAQALWANGSALIVPGSWQCWLWTGQTCPTDIPTQRLYRRIAQWSMEWTLPFCAVILRRCWFTLFLKSHGSHNQHHQHQQTLQQLQYYEQLLYQTNNKHDAQTQSSSSKQKKPAPAPSLPALFLESSYNDDASLPLHVVWMLLILLVLHAGGLLASPTSWYFTRAETLGGHFGSGWGGRLWSWIILLTMGTLLAQCIFENDDSTHHRHHHPSPTLPKRIHSTRPVHANTAMTATNSPPTPGHTTSAPDGNSVTSSITGTQLTASKEAPTHHDPSDTEEDDNDNDGDEIRQQSHPFAAKTSSKFTGAAAALDDWLVDWGNPWTTTTNNQKPIQSSQTAQYLQFHWISFPSTQGMILLLICITAMAVGTASPRHFTHAVHHHQHSHHTMQSTPDSVIHASVANMSQPLPTGTSDASRIMHHDSSAAMNETMHHAKRLYSNATTTTHQHATTQHRLPITPRFVRTWTWFLLQQVQMLITQIYVFAKGTETDRAIYYSILALVWFTADLVRSIVYVAPSFGFWWFGNLLVSMAFTIIVGTLTLHAILETVLNQFHMEYEEESAPLWIPPPIWKYLQHTRKVFLHVGIVGPKMALAIAEAITQQFHALLEHYAPEVANKFQKYQKLVLEHVQRWTPIAVKASRQLVDAGTEVIQTYLPQMWKTLQDSIEYIRKTIREGEWDRPSKVWERVQTAATKVQEWVAQQYEQFAAEARKEQEQYQKSPSRRAKKTSPAAQEEDASLTKAKYVGDMASVSMQSKKSQ